MKLKKYTTEELREELKERDAKESKKVCRMCRHWGNTKPGENHYWGDLRVSAPCIFFKCKKGNRYKLQSPAQKACEHFERTWSPIKNRAYKFAYQTHSDFVGSFDSLERGYKNGALEQKTIDIGFAYNYLKARNVLTDAGLEEFKKAMEESLWEEKI